MPSSMLSEPVSGASLGSSNAPPGGWGRKCTAAENDFSTRTCSNETEWDLNLQSPYIPRELPAASAATPDFPIGKALQLERSQGALAAASMDFAAWSNTSQREWSCSPNPRPISDAPAPGLTASPVEPAMAEHRLVPIASEKQVAAARPGPIGAPDPLRVAGSTSAGTGAAPSNEAGKAKAPVRRGGRPPKKAVLAAMIGQWAVVTGLVSDSDFNGRWGRVESFDSSSQRYVVSVHSDSGIVVAKLRSENLIVSDPAASQSQSPASATRLQ
eukprot:gnl/TRDRNA2_/TRDRNA2_165603_c0_seq1.p1 gnl/TRDRNA2_/TRDRNA2_165603_c0~~gnl/TRDRNA2_/TRDRNA2_165603_c0_seq1.p1  ORF type:complete len:291 (+),score=45.77 gnl/TRDRNA2_/TRDRNA2_165603_c0_seq1:62-874(+)